MMIFFEVTVADTSITTHMMTVSDQSLSDLAKTTMTKTQLLEFSLNFLLGRKPNTSILSSFDINFISRHFSNNKHDVRQWCDENSKNRMLLLGGTKRSPP